MKKIFLIFSIIISISFSQTIYAEVLSGSGIVPGQIWYSKDSLIEGDTTLIHTAIWNDNDYSILTKIEFYDGSILLGGRSITVKSNELKDVSILWKVTAGDHNISAKIASSLKDSNKEKISLSRISSTSSKNSVSKIVKNGDGEVVSLTNEIKDKVEEIVPQDVQVVVSRNINVLENFRLDNSKKISEFKDEAKSNIDLIKKEKSDKVSSSEANLGDSIKGPLAYVKLFFFSILTFIFVNKFVFYLSLVFVVFLLLRFIYRKIKRR